VCASYLQAQKNMGNTYHRGLKGLCRKELKHGKCLLTTYHAGVPVFTGVVDSYGKCWAKKEANVHSRTKKLHKYPRNASPRFASSKTAFCSKQHYLSLEAKRLLARSFKTVHKHAANG
jgi:hypothetical protein